jgi:hypothetical protein
MIVTGITPPYKALPKLRLRSPLSGPRLPRPRPFIRRRRRPSPPTFIPFPNHRNTRTPNFTLIQHNTRTPPLRDLISLPEKEPHNSEEDNANGDSNSNRDLRAGT